ncbi:MAG: EF-P lysine aminoacylase EpmA [PS1 clade bacterium]
MEDKSYLNKRHKLVRKIRSFFDSQGLIEVQTPSLLCAPTSDVSIDSIACKVNTDINSQVVKYLHTSPELEMKKLISSGSGDIYQICQVFRDNEYGSRNFNEFTMLEYYRMGFDIHELMDDIVSLLRRLGLNDEVTKISYSNAFTDFGNIDILNTTFEELKEIAREVNLTTDFDWIEDLQMLLFIHLVEPELKKLPICFIYDFPKQQSALAKIDGQVASRFEMYLRGIEIANGYDEIQDSGTYLERFNRENQKRSILGKKIYALDNDFLKKLENPIPSCSGVAIGIDRLLHQII